MIDFYSFSQKFMDYWVKRDITPIFEYNMSVGAGTFHPKCFFGSLSKNPSAYVFIQKSTRKADGRYGKSPNRFLNHHQLQVLITPAPIDIMDIYLEGLTYMGLDTKNNFITFNDNNWENISIGAIGVGWEVLCNNTEIGQFTYFQKMADENTEQKSVEIAIGLERNYLALNNQNMFENNWYNQSSYGDIFHETEVQFSKYFLELNETNETDFYNFQKECENLINHKLYLPAYDVLLKAIDVFNSLDAMGKLSIIQRKDYINTTRKLANMIANIFINSEQKY